MALSQSGVLPKLKLLSNPPENATVEGVLLRHVKQLLLSTYNNPSSWEGVSSAYSRTRFSQSGADRSAFISFFPSFVMNENYAVP